MGRSLRRAKKSRPVVRQAKKRTGKASSKVPLELLQKRQAVQEKLGVSLEWDAEKTPSTNYLRNNFLNNANAGFGRNRKADALQEKLDGVNSSELDDQSDDDLRALEGKERRSGKAPVPKLTTHQRQIVERLIQAHGADVEAMVHDCKLNSMLLPAGKLRRLLEAYRVHLPASRCAFRVPNKALW